MYKTKLSFEEKRLNNQKCGGPGCLQCPLVNTSSTTTVSGLTVKAAKKLNCKSCNIIYLWQCLLYANENSHFGRTIQKSHERTNTHRRCFSETKWEDSALSMHAHTVHENNFDLRNFKLTLVKNCSPNVSEGRSSNTLISTELEPGLSIGTKANVLFFAFHLKLWPLVLLGFSMF